MGAMTAIEDQPRVPALDFKISKLVLWQIRSGGAESEQLETLIKSIINGVWTLFPKGDWQREDGKEYRLGFTHADIYGMFNKEQLSIEYYEGQTFTCDCLDPGTSDDFCSSYQCGDEFGKAVIDPIFMNNPYLNDDSFNEAFSKLKTKNVEAVKGIVSEHPYRYEFGHQIARTFQKNHNTISDQLSNDLVSIHDISCDGTPEANMVLLCEAYNEATKQPERRKIVDYAFMGYDIMTLDKDTKYSVGALLLKVEDYVRGYVEQGTLDTFLTLVSYSFGSNNMFDALLKGRNYDFNLISKLVVQKWLTQIMNGQVTTYKKQELNSIDDIAFADRTMAILVREAYQKTKSIHERMQSGKKERRRMFDLETK
jgi:hypothetical protein